MKHLFSLLSIALLCTGFSPASESNGDEIVELQALELSDDLAKILREYQFLKVYEIDKANILRPLAGQRLAYAPETRKYIMAQSLNENVIEQTTDNYEVIELGGGTKAHCYCDDGADDCAFKPSSQHGPERDDFKCDGSCGCGIAITIGITKEIPRVQTAGGEWLPSDDLR